ncbi:MAG: PIN domain-containing protein [Bacteroidota bacterium]
MKVVVDANIIFSAILNSNGKIGDLLINSQKYILFIAPDFLRSEIFKHYSRLCEISGMTTEQVREAEYQIYKEITFISEEQIKLSAWLAAEKLVADVDPKDIQYVAFSKHFRCKIWSGDKTLMNGLAKKGFTNFMTTEELYNWRNDRLK